MLSRRALFRMIAAVGFGSIFRTKAVNAPPLLSGRNTNRMSDASCPENSLVEVPQGLDAHLRALMQWEELRCGLDGAELVRRYTLLDEVTERMLPPERLRGRCPFCPTRFDSFLVYYDTNSFYCEECEAEGTIVDFYARMEGIPYREALSHLLNLLDSNQLKGRFR
ncbi:MAG: CHC2 zinc finger domain-containing protein [Nitrospira sp.]|nr:CHC2 zinc finger domain-containing protein [Nitrospira sp.]